MKNTLHIMEQAKNDQMRRGKEGNRNDHNDNDGGVASNPMLNS